MVAELKDLGLAASPEAPTPRQLVFDDLAQLPYLTAVIKVQAIKLPARHDLVGSTCVPYSFSMAQLDAFSFT